MKKSRFENLNVQDECPSGYIDIAHERSLCTLGNRRAYCVKKDLIGTTNGIEVFGTAVSTPMKDLPTTQNNNDDIY